MNIKIVIEYDGTRYSGWQRQKNAPTIQETLETSIGEITGENISIIGSGRTDAGVNALGQVANFETKTKIPIQKLPYAINSKLPEDIVVKDAKMVPKSFHSRFSAKSKIYAYTIYNAPFPSPIFRKHSLYISSKLDIPAMAKAAEFLVGIHDFSAFKASGSPVKSPVRHIKRIEVTKNEAFIEILMEANGFLYNMVRIIAGTLLEVGMGKIKANDMSSILLSRDRKRAGKTLPPHGLSLLKVIY